MKKKLKIKSKLNPLFFDGIAHRGLHDEKIPENSMEAFLKAKEKNVAFELDVHVTKDNYLIVFHDSQLKRVTGKEGIVEDLTFKELRENYKLPNGEVIPTFDEVLDAIDEQVPIVVELKVYRSNSKAVAKKTLEVLKRIKIKSNFWIISFNPKALLYFRKSGFQRALLTTYDKKYRLVHLFKCLFEGVDCDKRFLSKRYGKSWIKHRLVNVFTIEKEEELDKYLPYVDTFTYQYISSDTVKDKLSSKKKIII